MTKNVSFHELMEQAQASIELYNKEFTSKQLNISYRKINNWDVEGLIPFDLPVGKWHSFSFMEACWIKLIFELRKLGLPISSIKNLKETVAISSDAREIFNDPDRIEDLKKVWSEEDVKQFMTLINNPNEEYDPMQFASTIFGLSIVSCILSKSPIYLLINTKGECIPLDKPSLENVDFQEEYEKFRKEPHISICVNSIISDVLLIPNKNQAKFYQRILNEDENDLLELLKQNVDADQITIRLKNGKTDRLIDLVELQKSEKVDPRSRLTELFLKDGYEEVSLITEKGVIKSVKRKRKIKL